MHCRWKAKYKLETTQKKLPNQIHFHTQSTINSSSKSRACNICTELAVQEQTSNSSTTADDNSNERDNCNGILDVSRTSNDSFADHGEDSLLPPEGFTFWNVDVLRTLTESVFYILISNFLVAFQLTII